MQQTTVDEIRRPIEENNIKTYGVPPTHNNSEEIQINILGVFQVQGPQEIAVSTAVAFGLVLILGYVSKRLFDLYLLKRAAKYKNEDKA